MNRRRFLALSAGTLAGAARRHTRTALGCIAHIERGSGPLFLHGFPLNGFQWRDAFDRSLGVCQRKGSELFWSEGRPDAIAEEARRRWAAQGDEA